VRNAQVQACVISGYSAKHHFQPFEKFWQTPLLFWACKTENSNRMKATILSIAIASTAAATPDLSKLPPPSVDGFVSWNG